MITKPLFLAAVVLAALAAAMSMALLLTPSVDADDCAVLTTTLDSLARGHHLVVVDSTSAFSWSVGDKDWHYAVEQYGSHWDSSYAHWFGRNTNSSKLPANCLTTERDVHLVSREAERYFIRRGERFPAERLKDVFPDAVGVVYVSLPGYNRAGDKAIIEVGQFCVGAACGFSATVELEKRGRWHIVGITGRTEY